MNSAADYVPDTGNPRVRLIALLNNLLTCAQTIRIQQSQATVEAQWAKHYRDHADAAWKSINQLHKAAMEILRDPQSVPSVESVETPAPRSPLPCPHCGTPAIRRRYQHDASRFFYACPSTDCNATHTDESDALAAWNRRTPTAPISPLPASP